MALASVLGLLGPGVAQTVAPSQVTPKTFAPFAPPPRAMEISAAAGLSAPAGAERFSLLIGRVDIDDAFPELAPAHDALRAKLAGKRASVAEIFAAAAELEGAYAEAGYPLVRLTTPPQKLVNGGPVRLVVVDGFVEEIKVDGVDERMRAAVLARVAWLADRRHVTRGEIERAILLAGDFSGVKLRSALAPGQRVGGVVLVLEGEHRLVTGAAGGDNRLPVSLGGRQANSSISINGPFGFGEQFYAALGAGVGGGFGNFRFLHAPLRVIGVGAIMPVGDDGFMLNPEYTYSHSAPRPVAQAPRTTGLFSRYALRGTYPVIRERVHTLLTTVAFEYLVQSLHAPEFSTNLSADRYRAARVELDWRARTPWEEPYRLSVQLSKGLGGRGGADAAWSNVPLSRQFGSPWFTKLLLRARLSQTLPEQVRLDLIGQAQFSFGAPLLLPEQLSLEGLEAVTGLAPGLATVDAGGTLRGEMSRAFIPPFDYGNLALSPYLFVAGGLGRLYQATAVEKSALSVGSFGAGVRSNIEWREGLEGLGLGIEFGQEYSNIPARISGRRVNVAGALRF